MKIFFGLVFILIGITTILAEGPVIWTGSIIFGFYLLIRGLKKNNDECYKEAFAHEEEIISMLSQGKTNDEIATFFFEKNQIYPLYTDWVISHIIYSLMEDESKAKRQMAEERLLMNKQSFKIHTAEECIQHFNLGYTVFGFNELVIMNNVLPSNTSWISGNYTMKNNYIAEDLEITQSQYSGTLILHKEYLFFFEQSDEEKGIGDAIVNKAVSYIPFSDAVSSGQSFINVFREEIPDYFCKSRIKELVRIYNDGDCIVCPLSEIKHIEVELIDSKYYVAIGFQQKEEVNWFWLTEREAGRRLSSFWANGWAENIKVACLNIGVKL